MKYISFLRGINVGGYNVIKMEELKRLFQELKFESVVTFIQSGNIIFESKEKNLDKLNIKIENHLKEKLGYEVKVLTRTFEDINNLIKHNPFKTITTDKVNKIYVAFLSQVPDEKEQSHLEKLSYEAEEFIAAEKEFYILQRKDKLIGKPLFSNNFLEKKLKVSATTRDWNTIIKISLL